jgi:hypothetical protein
VTRYPTKAGEPREVNNVLRSVRGVLASAGAPWAGSHTFRRTVATGLDEDGASLGEIAAQLGHASTSVTVQYIARKAAPATGSVGHADSRQADGPDRRCRVGLHRFCVGPVGLEPTTHGLKVRRSAN